MRRDEYYENLKKYMKHSENANDNALEECTKVLKKVKPDFVVQTIMDNDDCYIFVSKGVANMYSVDKKTKKIDVYNPLYL